MTRVLLAVLATLMLVAPALAQDGKAAAEYYVIIDTRSHKCTIVDKAPQVDSPAITLATDTIYPTRSEAEAAAKSLKPCLAS